MNSLRPRFALATLAALLATVLVACGGSASSAPSSAASAASSAPSQPAGSAGAAHLASTIPTTVGSVKLTVASGDLASLKGEIPQYDQLVAGLSNADVEPSDVLGAIGTPSDGGSSVRVSGLQVVGAVPGGIGMQGALTAWAQTIPGATVGGTNLGGKAVTSVTFSDGSAALYYYLYGPSTLYFVRTADQALATSAFSQLP